jgi:HK97 family phage portal protein
LGFFTNLLKPNVGANGIKLVTERGNGFYAWDGNLYRSDVIRACIRPEVRAIGKLTPKHVRNAVDGLKVNPEPYMRFLLEEPNPYMTGQMLLEKMTTQLNLNNNAFALVVKDDFDLPVGIYPIVASNVETIYSETGELNLRFMMLNGKMMIFPYQNIIHMRRDFNENDIFGESPVTVLKSLMEVVTTTDQGVIKAIKNSNAIRWLLKFNGVQRPEDVDKAIEDFTKNYLSINANDFGGAAGTDAKYDAQQVKPESYVPNAAIMDRTTARIYNFFNTNEKIVQSKYNEDEWNAYYEAVIEPDALQFSNEFTRKLFSRRERGFGNKIVFESSNLTYASMSTKLGLTAFVDRGMMTPNEVRTILNLGPIEGGDKPIRRLDTKPIEGVNMLNSKTNYRITNLGNKKYAIDFDGTLCYNIYPKIGAAKADVVNFVKKLKDDGNKLILWTCRTSELLDEAIAWCKAEGIEFDAINANLQSDIDAFGTDSRKINADVYLDDKALNVNDIGGENNED